MTSSRASAYLEIKQRAEIYDAFVLLPLAGEKNDGALPGLTLVVVADAASRDNAAGGVAEPARMIRQEARSIRRDGVQQSRRSSASAG